MQVICGECYDVCPTEVIHEHPYRQVAFKCDLCDGDPQCIAFCQSPHVLAVDLKVDDGTGSWPRCDEVDPETGDGDERR